MIIPTSLGQPRQSPDGLPLLAGDSSYRASCPPLEAALAPGAGGEVWGEAGDGADGAGLAQLVDVGGVEGAGAVELQGHGFDVDAQDPGGVWARAADGGGRGDCGDGDVVLALYFVDGLEVVLVGCLKC